MRDHTKRRCLWLIFLLAIASCRVSGPTPPRKLTGEQIADRASLATVRVVTEIEATVQVPDLILDSAALEIAAERPVAEESTANGKFRALMNTLLAEPNRFLTAGSTLRTAKSTIHSQGSGVIFSSDGYLATNAHVVVPDENDIKSILVNSIKQWVVEDVVSLQQGIRRVLGNASISDNARDRLVEMLVGYYVSNGHLSNVSRSIYAILGYTGTAEDLTLLRVACVPQRIGEPIPGKDIAILKMEGEDFPTVPLASSLSAADLRTGAEMYVVGFPASITLSTDLTMPSRLEPSQTVGHVSGIKEMSGGRQVIQTDTAINPGNSGGPALNDRGEVIGLATFKLNDQEGINFIVAVDLLQEFIHGLHVQPKPGAYTQKYLHGLDAYEHNDRVHALALFRELEAERPGIRPVENFIQRVGGEPARIARISPPDPRLVRSSPSEPQAAAPVPAKPAQGHGVPAVFMGILAIVLIVIVIVVVAANRH